MVMITDDYKTSFGQNSKNLQKNSSIYFGCENYDDTYYCDRLHDNFNSYEMTGKSSIIYNSTDSPQFVKDKQWQVIEMHSNSLKSIMFSNTSNSSPIQFSIAFWVKGVSLPNNPQTTSLGYIISQMNVKENAG